MCLSANYYEILVDILVYPRRHGGNAIPMAGAPPQGDGGTRPPIFESAGDNPPFSGK